MHEQAHCCDEAANHQLPKVAAFCIIRIVSSEECLSLMQNLMQIHCPTHLVIFNVMATRYTCSLSSIYRPHWLLQWSCHCSCMHIPVHSPWLPGYISVVQTVLVLLIMVGLFLDRPHALPLFPEIACSYLSFAFYFEIDIDMEKLFLQWDGCASWKSTHAWPSQSPWEACPVYRRELLLSSR